jgi:hypothetical protein
MKSVYKIGKSEGLNSSQAVLLMEIGEAHCCFAILDYANAMLVKACYYIAEEKDKNEILKEMIWAHSELKQSFRHSVITYYTPENVLVPSKLYRFNESQEALKSMYEHTQNVIMSESVAEWQLYNIYNVPSSIHTLISRNFATGNFWHVYSVALKNRVTQNEGGNIVIDFKTDSFSAVVIKNNSLQLAQIFPYVKAEGVLYWLLKTCKQLSLSQDEVTLTLSGLVDKRSSVFKGLYQYFQHIEFASSENDIQLSRDFEEYPVHYFSSLLKMASCVS